MFRTFLESLPSAAANPLAMVAFLATVLAWFFIGFRTRRLGLLLARLKDLPISKRGELIKAEMGVVLPEKINAEQWMRSRKHQYSFFGFLAL